ncbi:hypothetical protein PAJ34TS1_02770 [Paenibacillus azoreducens]|uniref:Uncharacterized protein n=1 Tax=Paenibacillus azoreducens TaxID=116718 RepID=A0A919YD33_9BACL|nr:hypothetical protein J34TS1_32460 [Paenibacillus azoreducens]
MKLQPHARLKFKDTIFLQNEATREKFQYSERGDRFEEVGKLDVNLYARHRPCGWMLGQK